MDKAMHFDVRVGKPVRHEALSIFPLFTARGNTIEYQLSEEAVRAGTVKIARWSP